MSRSQFRSKGHKSRSIRRAIESLESRVMMSTNVLSFHNDSSLYGTDTTETTLSPANVKVGSFGKLYTAALDGFAYAQPLVVSNEAITKGVNTSGAAGSYNVVYVETEADSVYAIDTASGKVLWKRSFLNTNGAGKSAGTDINNPQGASAITAPTSGQVFSTDITPQLGITGTPVIDLANNCMYVVPFTAEVVGGTTTYVQRIHAISLSDGTDVVTPYTIGITSGSNNNTTSIYAYGSGDGHVTDPYNGTGKQVVQFNALRENQRDSLSLVNGELYVNWSSHGDQRPYHGWVVGWNVGSLISKGFVLNGVFCTSPNGGGAGIWGGSAGLSFDPDHNNTFYFETGNGFGAGGGITLTGGFPTGGDYYEAVVKVTTDASTSPKNQNENGWGFKAADYFIPYNQPALDNVDQDLGSGSPVALPDSAGIPGHPHLLLAAGKQGVVYLIDRDDMGHFNTKNDDVINAVPDGSGHNSPPVNVTGVLSVPVYYNGTIYYVSGYSGRLDSFTISSSGKLVAKSQSAQGSFGYISGSPSLSSNGNVGGIIWQTDRANNELHAYDASTLATQLWNSGQADNSEDAVGTVVKFAVPTVANGEVFVGTSNSLVIYGLRPPEDARPAAPVLSATSSSSTAVTLNWTDSTKAPNTATGYSVEELIKGAWTVITTAPGGTTTLSVGGLTPLTSYSFRIRGLNGQGYSNYSNTATVTTVTTSSAGLNYSNGFATAGKNLVYNGSAQLNGSALQLTVSGKTYQAGSVFSATKVPAGGFNTTFQFQDSAGSNTADGFTFTLQSAGSNAVGVYGGGLGYQNVSNSVAVKFDLYSNSGEGNNSTGIFTNGSSVTTPAQSLTASGVNLHSGDLMTVTLAYDGSTLSETIKDTVTAAVFSTKYSINIPAITGATAFAGFTGATGGLTATQKILNWTFNPPVAQAPLAPSGLGATVASASSVNLNWSDNDSAETGFYLDRATDSAFTENLVTQTITGTGNSFTDTAVGLASGGTYYYRIRAFNSAGSSANSNSAMVSIPFSPAKATNFVVDSFTSTTISVHWTDNAGPLATGYHILRAVGDGSFTLYATLPAENAAPPSEYDWTDTNLTPNTDYHYHVQCFNVAGYNDFVGGDATTLLAPPTGVTISTTDTQIGLSWSAVDGAIGYNVYRGTSSGEEDPTPLATGITSTSYTDTAVSSGITYYYVVTAVNANQAPLPDEGDPSAEVSGQLGATGVGILTGTPIGTAGSYRGVGNTIANVFDGNLNTFFDAPDANLTDWAGLDLGSPKTITEIQFAPRAGYAARMVGGEFQASATPDFSGTVVTLYTIPAAPVSGQLTTVQVNPGAAYQYVRYVGGTQYVNIAEMVVMGY